MFEGVFSNKKILITGHTGFKGSWLTLWLKSLGADVCGYSDRVLEAPSHFSLLGLTDIRHEIGDICDRARLEETIADFKPDVIFHLAAQALVHHSLRDPLTTIQTNALGTATLLDVVKNHRDIQSVVLITSDKVYENKEWAWGYRESDQLGGKDPYSASKAAAELIIHSYLRSYFGDSKTIIATGRAGNVIGGGDWAADRIVPDCVRAWTKGQAAMIRNPLATRPWQHVLEPLSGYMRLAEMALNNERHINHQAYNFGPKSDVTQNVQELLSSMTTRWPGSVWCSETNMEKLAAPEAGLLKLSCDKAHRDLNWHPTWTYEETVNYTVDWYKAHAEDTNFDARRLGLEQIVAYCESAVKQMVN